MENIVYPVQGIQFTNEAAQCHFTRQFPPLEEISRDHHSIPLQICSINVSPQEGMLCICQVLGVRFPSSVTLEWITHIGLWGLEEKQITGSGPNASEQRLDEIQIQKTQKGLLWSFFLRLFVAEFPAHGNEGQHGALSHPVPPISGSVPFLRLYRLETGRRAEL